MFDSNGDFMLIDNKILNQSISQLFFSSSVDLTFNSSNGSFQYIVDPNSTLYGYLNFDYVYPLIDPLQQVVKQIPSDVLCAFVASRYYRGFRSSSITIFGETKSILEWHKYLIDLDATVYVYNLKKFKYFSELKERFIGAFPKKYHYLF